MLCSSCCRIRLAYLLRRSPPRMVGDCVIVSAVDEDGLVLPLLLISPTPNQIWDSDSICESAVLVHSTSPCELTSQDDNPELLLTDFWFFMLVVWYDIWLNTMMDSRLLLMLLLIGDASCCWCGEKWWFCRMFGFCDATEISDSTEDWTRSTNTMYSSLDKLPFLLVSDSSRYW